MYDVSVLQRVIMSVQDVDMYVHVHVVRLPGLSGLALVWTMVHVVVDLHGVDHGAV